MNIFTFLTGLKLSVALVLGLLLLPWIILALIFLFFSLTLLFPAFCIFFLALMLFKVIFKCYTNNPLKINHPQQEFKEQQVSLEMDSSVFSFDPYDESEDSKNEISETQNLSRNWELWNTWKPQSVEIYERKQFNDLMSFWSKQEKHAGEPSLRPPNQRHKPLRDLK